MQKAVLYTPSDRSGVAGTVELSDVPLPGGPERGHALVRIAHAGICGTDLHILSGELADAYIAGRQSRALGHEGSGHVIRLADDEDEAARRAIREGDLVVLQPVGQCGLCEPCRAGRYNQCDRLFADHLGCNWDGTWQSVLKVPLSRIHPVGRAAGGCPEPPADWATLAEPLSCVVNGLNRMGHVACTARALVTGAGIIGLLACVTLRRRGVARVTVSEPSPERRQLVEGLNGVLGGGLTACRPEQLAPGSRDGDDSTFDVAVECSGSPEAAARACELVGNGGRVLLLGIGGPDSRLVLEPLAAFLKEVTVLTAFANRFTLPEAVGLLGQLSRVEGLSLELLGVRRMPLAEYAAGVQLLRECKAAKVLLQP